MNNYEYSTIWHLDGAEKRAGDNSGTIFFFAGLCRKMIPLIELTYDKR